MQLDRWLWVVVLIGIFSPLANAGQTPIDMALIVHTGTAYAAWSHNNPWSSSTSKFTDDTIGDRFNVDVDHVNNGIFSFNFADTDIFKDNGRFGVESRLGMGRGDWRFTSDDVDAFVLPAASDPTPEPGTYILFATGIFAFALIGFRRKRSGVTPLT